MPRFDIPHFGTLNYWGGLYELRDFVNFLQRSRVGGDKDVIVAFLIFVKKREDLIVLYFDVLLVLTEMIRYKMDSWICLWRDLQFDNWLSYVWLFSIVWSWRRRTRWSWCSSTRFRGSTSTRWGRCKYWSSSNRRRRSWTKTTSCYK